MSSTNRTNASERHVSDYYVTPKEDVLHFLTEWIKDECEQDDYISLCNDLSNVIWLDPCAGGDDKHDMTYPWVLENELGINNVLTLDIRENSLADRKGDFLNYLDIPDVDITITNPPFNIAEQIILRSFDVTQKDGFVIMLLRLNFLGSKARKPFWDKYPAHRIYVHHKRMSFKDEAGTDSIEYAHFVWKVGHKGETLLKVI